jgi:hypothetical protein
MLLLGDANRGRGRSCDQASIAERRKIDKRDTIGVLRVHSAPDLERETRLSDARSSRQRKETATLQQELDFADLALSTDE